MEAAPEINLTKGVGTKLNLTLLCVEAIKGTYQCVGGGKLV